MEPDSLTSDESQAMVSSLNRLAKWRTVFAGWQLGTRAKEDPEFQAVRDAAEARLLMRVEMSALTKILIDNGVITNRQFILGITEEAELLSNYLEANGPGQGFGHYEGLKP